MDHGHSLLLHHAHCRGPGGEGRGGTVGQLPSVKGRGSLGKYGKEVCYQHNELRTLGRLQPRHPTGK